MLELNKIYNEDCVEGMKLLDDEWIEIDEYNKYKHLDDNGDWQVIKFCGDMAIYSSCTHCGYTHPCYKNKRNKDGTFAFGCEYDKTKEFNFCPTCGTKMGAEINTD